MQHESLTQLGLKFETDKATYHHFTDFYDKELISIKNNESITSMIKFK